MKIFLLTLLLLQIPVFAKTGKVHPGCITNDGKILQGKVKVVTYGEDYKVKIVTYGEDLRVERVTYGSNSCGKWQFVEYGEDFKIRFVDYGEDFQIKMVTYNPGV